MLRGSEKDAEGGELKGGGNGRDGRFANNPIPVSNRNGNLERCFAPSGSSTDNDADGIEEYDRRLQHRTRHGGSESLRRRKCERDLEMATGGENVTARMPTMNTSVDPVGSLERGLYGEMARFAVDKLAHQFVAGWCLQPVEFGFGNVWQHVTA